MTFTQEAINKYTLGCEAHFHGSVFMQLGTQVYNHLRR